MMKGLDDDDDDEQFLNANSYLLPLYLVDLQLIMENIYGKGVAQKGTRWS